MSRSLLWCLLHLLAVLAALCELLLFYVDVGRVNLAAVLIRIAARLEPSGYGHFHSLSEILTRELSALAERYARDKICRLLSVLMPARSVYCERIAGDCRLLSVLSGIVSDLRISREPA